MSEQIQLPAIPTDTALSQEFLDRPDWDALEQLIEGVDGRELYEERDFGPMSLVQIQGADAKVRDYLKVYAEGGAYWNSKWGKAEKALEDLLALFRDRRIAEMKRCKQFRANTLRIMAEHKQADDEAIAAKQRAMMEEQREDAERDKQSRLNTLYYEAKNASAAGDKATVLEIQAEIEQVKSNPTVPPSVSPMQARAALGVPATPAGIVSNKRPMYERHITDLRKFIHWLDTHHHFIAMLGIAINFAAIKYSPVEIDGVTRTLKTIVQNRGK